MRSSESSIGPAEVLSSMSMEGPEAAKECTGYRLLRQIGIAGPSLMHITQLMQLDLLRRGHVLWQPKYLAAI